MHESVQAHLANVVRLQHEELPTIHGRVMWVRACSELGEIQPRFAITQHQRSGIVVNLAFTKFHGNVPAHSDEVKKFEVSSIAY